MICTVLYNYLSVEVVIIIGGIIVSGCGLLGKSLVHSPSIYVYVQMMVFI